MPEQDTPAKVNVEIPRELHAKLNDLLPHGARKRVVNQMLHDLVELLEGEDDDLVHQTLGAIMSGRLPYEQFSSTHLPNYESRGSSNEHNRDDGREEAGEDNRET